MREIDKIVEAGENIDRLLDDIDMTGPDAIILKKIADIAWEIQYELVDNLKEAISDTLDNLKSELD